jgi:predicted RNA-binding Zn-ribbon protein involved in translation (DUF1610 family)
MAETGETDQEESVGWYCPHCDKIRRSNEVVPDDDPPTGLIEPTPFPLVESSPSRFKCGKCGYKVVWPVEDDER